jgi:Endonuclease/Exonuclease/phosphatase family
MTIRSLFVTIGRKQALWAIFFLGLCSAVNAQNAGQKPTVVAFYNFENLYDTLNDPKIDDEDFQPNGAYAYTGEIYRTKQQHLETVVSKFGIDANPDGFALLGTAEIENGTVLRDLCNQPWLKKRNIKFVQFDSPDRRGIDVALLYNPAYFKVLQARALPVIMQSDGTGKEFTRDVLWVTGKLNGEVVHVFVNHWPSRRGGEAASAPKRKLAAGVSKAVYDSLIKEDPNVKTIIMGDLNDDPINESITEVLGAEGKLKNVKGNKMFNPFMDFYKNGIGTLAYQDAWGLFDQIILSPSFVIKNRGGGVKFDHARVFNESFLIEKFGQYKGYPKRSFVGSTWNDGFSDHFPSMIYLK